jgi:predicted nucleic acid-binding protein
MTRSFLDAGVLIASARSAGDIPARAHAILDDPERGFITSDYLRMEVLPKALYHQRRQEALLYETYFARAAQVVPPSAELMRQAYEDACAFGLSALDALHIAAARLGGAEEFLTTERTAKPLFRVTGLLITSIATD